MEPYGLWSSDPRIGVTVTKALFSEIWLQVNTDSLAAAVSHFVNQFRTYSKLICKWVCSSFRLRQ